MVNFIDTPGDRVAKVRKLAPGLGFFLGNDYTHVENMYDRMYLSLILFLSIILLLYLYLPLSTSFSSSPKNHFIFRLFFRLPSRIFCYSIPRKARRLQI